MHIGIELFAFRIDLADLVLFHGIEQFGFRQLHPGQDIFHITAFTGGLRHTVDGPAQIVGDAQDIAGEFRDRIIMRILFFPLGPAAHVFNFCHGPEELVFQVGNFGIFFGNDIRLLPGFFCRCCFCGFPRGFISRISQIFIFHLLIDRRLFRVTHSVCFLFSTLVQQFTDHFRRIIDHRNDTGIVEPGRTDDADGANDLLLTVLIGRDNH